MKKLWTFTKCLFFFLLMGGLIFGIYWDVRNYIKLNNFGEETIAIVLKYQPNRTRKRTYHYHLISYDSFTHKMNLFGVYDPGTKFYVVYLHNKPDVVKIGRKGDSFSVLIDKNGGWGYEITGIAFGILVTGSFAIANLIHLIRRRECPICGRFIAGDECSNCGFDTG